MADSEDEIALSSDALDALKAFYAERDAHAREFARLQEAAEQQREAARLEALSMSLFIEDWNKSQFWYADETAQLFARQLLDGATKDMTVVVVSAPSVFVQLRNLTAGNPDAPKLFLLEHDDRFTVFKDQYIFYDFAHPFKLPAHLKGTATRIIVDPPFLSEDCQTKAAMTVRWLSDTSDPSYRVIVCTGERMGHLITTKLYKPLGVKTTDYEPVHARGLSNEFYCYTNFECEAWKWRFEGPWKKDEE